MREDRAEKSPEKILIVDDFPDNLSLLSAFLHQQGYKVDIVTNGEVGVKLARISPPDLVLLDIIMPGMDGYQVCRALKAGDVTREIPVIFLSGLDLETDKVKAFKVGAVDYITKPFYLEEVVVRIETQLNLRKQKQLIKQELKQQIRERQRTEKMLYQSRTLLASVLNSSLDGVAAFESIRDEQGQIIDFQWLVANPIAAMTVGETSKSLIGKRSIADLPNNPFNRLFDSFVEVVENCTVLEKEHFCLDESLPGWFYIVAVKLGDGLAITFRDITESKQLEIALQEANQELQRQANLDSLTKIANRRRFDEYIAQEWARCTREKQYLSLILCDIDYFKPYNDNYGHPAGDICLAKVAECISVAIKRPTDLLVRYGGEEFAAILPNTNSKGGLTVAEEMRQAIASAQIPHNFSQVSRNISLSLGVASIIPQPHGSWQDLVDAADRALYEAKHQGRNCVVFQQIEPNLASENKEIEIEFS